jgi:hypothetical protein
VRYARTTSAPVLPLVLPPTACSCPRSHRRHRPVHHRPPPAPVSGLRSSVRRPRGRRSGSHQPVRTARVLFPKSGGSCTAPAVPDATATSTPHVTPTQRGQSGFGCPLRVPELARARRPIAPPPGAPPPGAAGAGGGGLPACVTKFSLFSLGSLAPGDGRKANEIRPKPAAAR